MANMITEKWNAGVPLAVVPIGLIRGQEDLQIAGQTESGIESLKMPKTNIERDKKNDHQLKAKRRKEKKKNPREPKGIPVPHRNSL